jgi:hypothetical protein
MMSNERGHESVHAALLVDRLDELILVAASTFLVSRQISLRFDDFGVELEVLPCHSSLASFLPFGVIGLITVTVSVDGMTAANGLHAQINPGGPRYAGSST